MIDREAERELRAVDGGDEEGEVLAKDEPAVKNVIHATEKQAAQMARKVCAYGCVCERVISCIVRSMLLRSKPRRWRERRVPMGVCVFNVSDVGYHVILVSDPC